MPELPEVETIARRLEPELAGRTIKEADLRWSRTLATPSPRKFKEQVKGQRIQEVTRRAKYFILRLSDFELLVHLRMSGDLFIRNSTIQPEKHDRLVLKLSGGKSLVFNDTRKFGRVWLTADPQELLDQSFLAGLGNIYTDEALHIAKLHPLGMSDSVSKKQAQALHEAIRQVLKEGIRRNGASIDWAYRGGEFQNYFQVYDREGEPCAVCGAEIQKLVVGQRGTHVCPKCQVLR
jgi:formamidopyrimidine-DNA glycosylase